MADELAKKHNQLIEQLEKLDKEKEERERRRKEEDRKRKEEDRERGRKKEALEKEKDKIAKKMLAKHRKTHPYFERRCFIRELVRDGVSIAEIAREGNISYYKARQIKLGKKKLRSDSPEYRKIINLHRRRGYKQLRAKGLNPKEAQRLRSHKLRTEPTSRKKRGEIEGYFLLSTIVTTLETGEVFVDEFTSITLDKKDIILMRKDVLKQAKIRYEYNEGYEVKSFEIIKEEIIDIYVK